MLSFNRIILPATSLFLINQLMITNAAIPSLLRDYIKQNKRLEKYSITLLMDYGKNATENYLVEKLYLRSEDGVGLNISALKNVEINVVLCQKEYDFDCKFDKNKGYSVSVLEILKEILGFKIKYTILEFNTEEIDLLDEIILTNNSFDIILCHPTPNNTIYQVLHPTLKTSYVIVYRPNNLSFDQDIFIITFAGTLWLCFIIIIIILAICLNISTMQLTVLYGYPSWGTVDITFWAIAAACQQGLSSTPIGFSSRFIFFLGYLTAYLLYTGFAAGVTSLLAVQNENYILKIADIERNRFKVISFGNTGFLPAQYSYLRHSQHVKSLDAFLKRLEEERLVGLTTKIALDQYLVSNEKKIDHCIFIISNLGDSEISMSFLVPKNWKYRKLFNYWLLRLDEAGILNATSQSTQPDIPTCPLTSGYSSAGLDHVESAILLLAVGIVVSLVFLIVECLWTGYKHRIAGKN